MKAFSKCLTIRLIVLFFSFSSVYGQTFDRPPERVVSHPISAGLRSGNVFLFFEEDAVGFNYEELSTIELTGPVTDETLDKLKYAAHREGANAIVNIRLRTAYCSGGENDIPIAVIKKYTGLAVRIKPDSIYTNGSLGDWRDTLFVTNLAFYDVRDRHLRGEALKNYVTYNHHCRGEAISDIVLSAFLLLGFY